MRTRKDFDEMVYDYRRLVENTIAPFMGEWLEIKKLCDEHKEDLLNAFKRANCFWRDITDIDIFYNVASLVDTDERDVKVWAYKGEHLDIVTTIDICTLYDYMERANIITKNLNQ